MKRFEHIMNVIIVLYWSISISSTPSGARCCFHCTTFSQITWVTLQFTLPAHVLTILKLYFDIYIWYHSIFWYSDRGYLKGWGGGSDAWKSSLPFIGRRGEEGGCPSVLPTNQMKREHRRQHLWLQTERSIWDAGGWMRAVTGAGGRRRNRSNNSLMN